ncbi:MAG: hypothetical protein ACRDA3_06940 [Peptostreptococcaceae bacterium]
MYIIVGKYEADSFIVLDTYKKMGLDISHFKIKPLLDINNKTIIVGFKIRSVSSNLGLLVFKDFKLKNIIEDENIYFGKMDVIDFNRDGIYEIALWTHDTGEAYVVNIYELVNNELKKTDKYNKFYYTKVLNYYANLVKKYPTSSTYLYYLAKVQCILFKG